MQESLDGQEFPRNVLSLKELHQVWVPNVSQSPENTYFQGISSKLKKRLKFRESSLGLRRVSQQVGN